MREVCGGMRGECRGNAGGMQGDTRCGGAECGKIHAITVGGFALWALGGLCCGHWRV